MRREKDEERDHGWDDQGLRRAMSAKTDEIHRRLSPADGLVACTFTTDPMALIVARRSAESCWRFPARYGKDEGCAALRGYRPSSRGCAKLKGD